MAHEIEKLPVSAELLKCSSLPAVCGYFISTHCIRRSYYRTRVQESEGIVQDALGRLTCLEVPPPPLPSLHRRRCSCHNFSFI